MVKTAQINANVKTMPRVMDKLVVVTAPRAGKASIARNPAKIRGETTAKIS